MQLLSNQDMFYICAYSRHIPAVNTLGLFFFFFKLLFNPRIHPSVEMKRQSENALSYSCYVFWFVWGVFSFMQLATCCFQRCGVTVTVKLTPPDTCILLLHASLWHYLLSADCYHQLDVTLKTVVLIIPVSYGGKLNMMAPGESEDVQ